ncbi:MAG: NAD(P)/FAD-dependent oxidoreductase [Clostridia bacterium]|nr:NAD(P)/FAD-dependent oxidoreductase [Clostridia bacterium]
MKNKRKALIIGGGVSGMATGIYLLNSGYDVEILEKNTCPGGACVGWERKGCYIDGCIHWLVGTNTESPYYKMWREIGALNDETEIFFQNDFSVFDFPDGTKLTVWADLKKFHEELLSIAPEDEKEINKFIRRIRRFRTIEGPVDKPVDMMSPIRLLHIGFTMWRDYFWVAKYSKVDNVEYGKRFKNKKLQYFFANYMAPGYNHMSMLYMLAHVMNKDGGIPIGGSMAMSERIYKKFTSLGGVMRFGKEVQRVRIIDNRAVGAETKDGDFYPADWVVSSTATEHCLKKLLGGEYPVKKIDERLANKEKYPIYTMTIAVFKCSEDIRNMPLGLHAVTEEPLVIDKEYDGIALRNYAYDKTMKTPDGSCVLQAQIVGDDDMYFWWKARKQNGTYREEKARVGKEIHQKIISRYPELAGKLELIDFVTPCTYERYLNTRHGSFQGFVHTKEGKALMQKGMVKGLKNFILSGQCIFQSGGLPPAMITGKFAAMRICKEDGVFFRTHSPSPFIIPITLKRKQKVR